MILFSFWDGEGIFIFKRKEKAYVKYMVSYFGQCNLYWWRGWVHSSGCCLDSFASPIILPLFGQPCGGTVL